MNTPEFGPELELLIVGELVRPNNNPAWHEGQLEAGALRKTHEHS